MNATNALPSIIAICDIHANRLQKALTHLNSHTPISQKFLNTLSDENLAYLELLTNRFTKLQDTIGAKIFPLILSLMQEDVPGPTFIDRLNLLEKIGILKKTDWIELREIRNHITHEYPESPEVLVIYLNKAIDKSRNLIEFWNNLKTKIKLVQAGI